VHRPVLAVLLVAFVAGCANATTPARPGGGAAVAPKSAALLLRIDTSFSSSQWQALEALLGLFPEGKAILSRVGEAKRALGPETDLVALGPGGPLLWLTQPRNPAELESLLAKHDPPLVSELIGSWRVIARDRTAIDRFKQARNGGSLLDNAAYMQATSGLPAGSPATVYADGAALTQALGKRLKTGTGLKTSTAPIPGLGRVAWAAGALTAQEHGIGFDLRIQGDEIEAAPFAAELPAVVPAGVSLYVGFKGLDATLDELRRSPAFASVLGSNAKLLGGLLDDTIALFEGEGAFYVRGDESTLVLKVADQQAAAATLERLATVVGALSQQVPERILIGDVLAKKLVLGKLALYYAVFGGKLVITTAESGIAGLEVGSGARLAGSQAWRSATAAAGLPHETAGILYADLQELPQAHRDLKPLGTALAWASVNGSVLTVKGFVSVR
jgi:hypothetical protein